MSGSCRLHYTSYDEMQGAMRNKTSYVWHHLLLNELAKMLAEYWQRDVELIRQQTGCSTCHSVFQYVAERGDIVNAIMALTM